MDEKMTMYKVFRTILGPIYRLWYNPKIIGRENIPKEGSIVVVGNHIHIMDQCNIVVVTKRNLHYMAKKEYFDGKMAWFFKMMGCISVNRSIHDEHAKEEALNVLFDGKALGIFPEGTRNKTDAFMLPLKYGCVSMAKKTDAYIVPFSVVGDYKFRSKNLVYRIGKPFKVTNMELAEANQKLARQIGNLMKKSMSEQNKK